MDQLKVSFIFRKKISKNHITMHVYIFDVTKNYFSLIYMFYPIYYSSDFAYFDFCLYIAKSNGKSKNVQINKFYYYYISYYICLFLNIKLIIINDDFSIFEFQNQILKIHFIKFQSPFFIFT